MASERLAGRSQYRLVQIYAALARRVGIDILLALGIPDIVRGLHTDPSSGTVTEQFTHADRCGSGHRLTLAQNIVQMLARDAKQLCNLSFGPPGRWNNVIPQQRTGMGRTTGRISFGSMNQN